jgi:hypothetical protein
VDVDVEEHRDTDIACVVGTGQKMDRAQDAIHEDLQLAEEAGMLFPEAVVEVEADELEVLNTVQLRERGKALGVVPVGDGRTAEAWRLGSKPARERRSRQ